jgi:hypothetical protein
VKAQHSQRLGEFEALSFALGLATGPRLPPYATNACTCLCPIASIAQIGSRLASPDALGNAMIGRLSYLATFFALCVHLVVSPAYAADGWLTMGNRMLEESKDRWEPLLSVKAQLFKTDGGDIFYDPYTITKIGIGVWEVNMGVISRSNGDWSRREVHTYRVDCTTKAYSGVGWRIYGTFTPFKSPKGYGTVQENSYVYMLLCGQNLNGSTYYGMGVEHLLADGTSWQIGVKNNEVFIDESDPLRRYFNGAAFQASTQTLNYGTVHINCVNQQFAFGTSEQLPPSSAPWTVASSTIYKSIVARACNDNIAYLTRIRTKISTPQIVQAASPSSSPSNAQGDERIEAAKSKCQSLGFTPKTEKFGQCVLKLSE